MFSRRLPAAFAGVACLSWLTLTTGYGAAAALAPSDPVDLGGARLSATPSTSPAEPTPLAPGLWKATLAPEFPQYFSYQRRINESNVHIGVLGAPQGVDSDGIKVTAGVRTEGSTDLTGCGDESDSSEYVVPQAVVGNRVIVGDEDGSTGDTCRAADTVFIAVSRTSSSAEDLPYVIKIVEEAPVSDGGGVEPDDAPVYEIPEPVGASDEAGAASFDDAPKVDAHSGTVTIETTIKEGTELLWRVPLAWGDLPVVRVDVPAASKEHAEDFAHSGPDLSVHLIDPLRGRLRYVNTEREDSATGQYVASETGETDQLVAAGYPVRRANGRLPGDYWISLAAEAVPEAEVEDRDPVDIPVTITVAVDATDAATPTYDGVAVSHDKSTNVDGYSPKKPFLVADDTFSAAASGNPVVDSDDSDGWLNGRHLAGLGLGAASLACLAGGLFRLRARR
ncbi:hypothetical protein [Nocardioides sp. WS12]|uniref:hypothetical protein n=1 Tax=Nocardioides sp. WS12 TaxID=2486272 RepID=UPI0015FD1102|nr:hypothetical protein [Nocardioides sp. WS12]